MNKLVFTGADVRPGSYLGEPLTQHADQLISSDLADGIGRLYPSVCYQKAVLTNYDDIHRLPKRGRDACPFRNTGRYQLVH